MTIIWNDVVDLAPELETLSTAAQTRILAQVNTELSESAWGDRVDYGRIYLAAHLGTLQTRGASGGQVVSESVGSVSRTYSVNTLSTTYGATAYGTEFERLLMMLPAVRFAIG